MAIDQRDVSSKLRFMDDGALQQYAAMHKNDPYIFPLAFQESQNRQRLRMQQQAQAGAQPQPKVADQALAQMAPQQAQPMPEDVGIGALPAPNMTMAAEGGIMGYEGYDEGPNDFGQEPVLRMAEGGVARYNGETGSVTNSRSQFVQDVAAVPGMYDKWWRANREEDRIKAERDRALAQRQQDELAARQKTSFANYLFGSPEREAEGEAELAQLSSSAPATYNPAENLKKLAKTDKYVSTSTPNNAEEAKLLNRYPTAKPAAKKDGAAPRADTGRPSPASGATDPSAKPETGGLDALIQNFTRQTDLAMGANKNARVGQAALLEKEATEEAAATKKRIKEEGDVFKGKEERLAAREKGIEGMGDKYMGLALLQAGAAMMSTPGNIGAALGKGIQVGSERYIAGIDKINAAKDKFAEARDRLDDLRLNRDDMNKKEIRDADRAIRTARIQGQQLLVDGAGKDLEISSANQKAIFGAAADNLKTDKEIASREKTANAQISATLSTPERQMWNQALAKHNGDTTAAFKELQTAKAEKFNAYQSYADYLKAFAGKDTALTPPQDFSKYVSQFSIPTTTAPAKGATVLKQP